MGYDKYRILKQGKDLWVVIEPKRQLTLHDDNNQLIHFSTKEAALKYCNDSGFEVAEEYSASMVERFNHVQSSKL